VFLNSGGKKKQQEKKKEEKIGKIPKIVATFVYASSKGQRTHSAWTKIIYTPTPSIFLPVRGKSPRACALGAFMSRAQLQQNELK
jgi:hypothetical protein